MTGEGLALVRNPHFHVWSPAAQPDGYVDRIEWTFGVEPAGAGRGRGRWRRRRRVRCRCLGQARGALRPVRGAGPHLSDCPRRTGSLCSIPTAPLRRRRGATGGEPRGRPGAGRADLRRRCAARPTCQQLPPNFPGYEPYCPYTMDPGPEGRGRGPPRTSRRPKGSSDRSGTAGMRVVFEYAPAFWPQGDRPGRLHGRAARRARIPREREGHPARRLLQPRQRVPDGASTGWAADYPAASNFITNSSRATHPLPLSSGFCDPRIDAMIDRATRCRPTTRPRPARSGRRSIARSSTRPRTYGS